MYLNKNRAKHYCTGLWLVKDMGEKYVRHGLYTNVENSFEYCPPKY